MLLKVTHLTDLRYDDLINESIMELRMVPRQEADQHRLSFDLAIGPATTINSYFDWLGNTVHTFSVNAFHQQIRITATSVVETDRPRKEVERFRDLWPIASNAYEYNVYDFLQFGGPIVDCPELHELIELIAPREGTSLGEIALRMLHLIDDKFTYKKGITNSASPISHILKSRAGVCQDFTHLMIGCLRSIGLPARYISGYILTHPSEGQARLIGADASHAWVSVYCPEWGWVDFDPTNRSLVQHEHITLGWGRDFSDVTPLRGIVLGGGQQILGVSVTVTPLHDEPGGLLGIG